jgi:DNA polymerase III subunit epsilon
MRWPWQKPAPAWMQAYLEATPRKVDRRRPVSEITFLVLDAETTGFDLAKDRLLSLAALPVRDGRLSLREMNSWVVFQQSASRPGAFEVHGILREETAAGEQEAAVLQGLLQSLAGAIVVGHHIGFDLAMINAAIRRAGGVPLRHAFVDTAKLAQHALDAFARTGYPGQRDPSLDELCVHLGIEPVERHTAEGDVFTTATLFLSLLAHLRRRQGRALTLADLPIGVSG